MKKYLLLSMAIACGISVNAQVAKGVQPAVTKAVVPTMARTTTSAGKLNAEFATSGAKVTNFSKVRRAEAVSDLEAVYDIPAGAWIEGADPAQGWYPVPYVYTPGLVEQVWENYSSSSDQRNPIEYNWSDSDESFEWSMDENGNGVASMFGAILTPVLTATQGDAEVTYQLGQEGSAGYGVWFGGTKEFTRLGGARFGTGNGPYSGFTNLDLYTNTPGEMTDTQSGKVTPYFGANIVGFAQYLVAPNDFAAANCATLTLGTDDNTLEHLLNGQKITCTIYEIEKDGSLGEPIKVIEAGEENCIALGDWLVSIEFPFVEEDPLFGEIESPLYINGNDLLITFSGFENVSNPYFAPFCSAAGFTGGGYMLLDDGSLNSVFYRGSEVPQIDLMVTLTSVIPVLEAATELTEGAAIIPAEGGYAVTVIDGGEAYNDFDVYTLNADVADFSVYSNDEEDEWVSCEADDTYAEKGIMVFYFKAEALPEGVEGRSCVLNIDLQGKTIEIPVVQGDVDTAVESLPVNNKMGSIYNIAGQRVNAAQKGVFIQNGKKFVNK